jgi:hypothetical protein
LHKVTHSTRSAGTVAFQPISMPRKRKHACDRLDPAIEVVKCGRAGPGPAVSHIWDKDSAEPGSNPAIPERFYVFAASKKMAPDLSGAIVGVLPVRSQR